MDSMTTFSEQKELSIQVVRHLHSKILQAAFDLRKLLVPVSLEKLRLIHILEPSSLRKGFISGHITHEDAFLGV